MYAVYGTDNTAPIYLPTTPLKKYITNTVESRRVPAVG